MPRKAKRFPNTAVMIALMLSMAANGYLIMHFVHVDIQPTSPLLKAAMRRIRNANRSVDLVPSSPPDSFLEPSSTDTSDDHPRLSSRRANNEKGNYSDDDSRNSSRPGLADTILTAIDAAASVFGRLLFPPRLSSSGSRCPGNLSCGNFSASFSRESWNREEPKLWRRRQSRRSFER
jgi:hypothetical protein